jgi:hypothetical protein
MLQDEDHNGKSDLRKRIDRLVECDGDGWARTIGLQDASGQFYEDVRKSIRSCTSANSDSIREIGEKLERINREAEAAANSLWSLHAALQDLTPEWREWIDDGHGFGKLNLDLIPARAQWVRVIGNRVLLHRSSTKAVNRR